MSELFCKRQIVIILSVSLCLVGCAQIKELIPLQKKIIEHFQENNIEIRLQNNQQLMVSFINPTFLSLSKDERRQKAREIAVFIKENYESINNIDTINVFFIQSESYIIATSRKAETYGFKKNSL